MSCDLVVAVGIQEEVMRAANMLPIKTDIIEEQWPEKIKKEMHSHLLY